MKKLNLILSSFLIVLFIILSNNSHSKDRVFVGTAKVIDGDTIKINNNKIRLFGIDAPEKKQICKKIYLSIIIFHFQKEYNCGRESSLALSKKLKNKKIKCILDNKKDRYNRFIGTCYVEAQDINSWLVKKGYAVAYKRYSKKYIFDEKYAKENRLGIWRGTFMEPEKWRRNMN